MGLHLIIIVLWGASRSLSVSLCVSVCLSDCLSVSVSLSLFLPLSVCQSVCLSVGLSLLFSLFINELALDIINNGRHGVSLSNDFVQLVILLFADDMILLSPDSAYQSV